MAVVYLLELIPSAKVLGLELAYFPYHESRLIQRWFGPGNLSFERKDFWTFDCSDADAVLLYFGPGNARRMGEKLKAELKPGGLVISNSYPLLGPWDCVEEISLLSPFKETIYVYRQT